MADVCHLSKKVIMCFINVGVGRCRVSHWIWRKHFNWWILEIKLAQMKQGKGNFAKRVISIMQWMTRYSEYRYTPMIFNIWYRNRWPNIFLILGLIFFNSAMWKIRGAEQSIFIIKCFSKLLWRRYSVFIKYKFHFVVSVGICQMPREVANLSD